jgi:uncharacterized membrane protein
LSVARTLRHLGSTRARTRRRFPDELLDRIAAAIRAVEARTSGEIRFVIETALEIPDIWRGITPRERALQTFSDLHVWNTRARNGVLIYVLAADRDVEVVADRGAADLITQEDWEGVCRQMEAHFHEDRFADGSLAGVEAVGGLLVRHFPVTGQDRDELPNQPTLL